MTFILEALRWAALIVAAILLIGLAEGVVWCVLVALFRAGRRARRNRIAHDAGWANYEDFERWRTKTTEYGRQVKGG